MHDIEEARAVLQGVFGHEDFRGLQAPVIANTLQGKNSLVLMPTGMGKSICYQIPALVFDGLCVVVSPLIALMKDQVDQLRGRGVDASFINSSLTRKERESRYRALRSGEGRLLYVTPERFRKQEFLEALATRKVSLLAVDEAHCVSEWGHDFRPDYTRLGEIRAQLGNPVTQALTATATTEVQNDIALQLGLAGNMDLFHGGVERPNLACSVDLVYDDTDKLDRILALLRKARGSCIVYFSLIRTLEHFSRLLAKAKTPHAMYHGKLEAGQRRRIQDEFMSGRQRLVLATNAFGLGIDKEDIGLIVHAELPGSLESYAQEIGRAGRDGLPAQCALLYAQEDLLIQMDFTEWANPPVDYLQTIAGLLHDHPQEANSGGEAFFAERLIWKGKRDPRLDTALALLDRFGVTQGCLESHNLRVLGDLPENLCDVELRAEKRQRDLMRLQQMVAYANSDDCRRRVIHAYFGFEEKRDCGICDNCA